MNSSNDNVSGEMWNLNEGFTQSSEQLYQSTCSETQEQDLDGLFSKPRKGPDNADEYGLVQQLHTMRYYSSNPLDFLGKTTDLLLTTIVVRCLFVVLLAFPVSMLIMGGTYRNDCPEIENIPLFLLVAGFTALAKVLCLLLCRRTITQYERMNEEDDRDPVLARFVRFTNIGLNAFLVGWFIFGSTWYFSTAVPSFERNIHSPNAWCDSSVYHFCFFTLILPYVIFVIVFVYALVVVCLYFTK